MNSWVDFEWVTEIGEGVQVRKETQSILIWQKINAPTGKAVIGELRDVE